MPGRDARIVSPRTMQASKSDLRTQTFSRHPGALALPARQSPSWPRSSIASITGRAGWVHRRLGCYCSARLPDIASTARRATSKPARPDRLRGVLRVLLSGRPPPPSYDAARRLARAPRPSAA